MILFIADIHIKLGQKNVPVEWAKKRYESFFSQLVNIECDEMILGGDIFDRLPTMEELELFFNLVAAIEVPTKIYDGNHEATKKNKTFLSFLKVAVHSINPLVEIVTDIEITDRYTIVPYNHIHTVKWNELPNKPVFTHVRGEIPPHVKPEIDLTLLDRFPVVFAGDLHSHSNTQRNIVYPGSPMTTSFHRKPVDTGYLLIDQDFSWSWHPFNLPQLIRKTVSSPDEMISTDYDHTIYELEGDIVELSNIRQNDLLDKKLVKRSSDASLILKKEMTITDELIEYLLYILEIPEEKIEELVGVYNDYTKRANLG